MANKHSSKSKKRVFLFGKRSIEALPDPEPGERYPCQDTRNPYLFLRVTRNKKNTHTTKTFYWQRTINSKQKTVTIDKFPTINVDLARDQADDIAADYVKGTDVQEEAREARSQLTLGELWADFRVNRKRGHGRISEAHEYVWERHFKPWEKKKVSNISYNMARKMILDIRKTAPIHGNRVQRLGKAIWNHGINELRLKGIENPFTFSQVSEKGRSRKTFRLQRTDMPAFMEALDALPGDNMKDLFLSSLFTGRRIGECKAMRWVDVDLESGLWVIPNTKSGEAQTCVLPKLMVDLLTERKPKGKGKSEWVFPANSKSGHVEAINTAWKQIRSHGFQHLQARDLRGTLASWLQEAGVPLVGAQQQLGHADISTTAGSYTTISHSLQRIGLDSATAAMLEAAK